MFLSEEVSRTLQLVVFIRKKRSNACRERSADAIVMQYSIALHMCIWKAWKKVRTKVANLIRYGINQYQAYEWGNTRKGYWRIVDSPILTRTIDNYKLRSAGYATLIGSYLEWHPIG